MRAVHHRLTDLEGFQQTAATDLADQIVRRLQPTLTHAHDDGENRKLSMRDFWIALGFLGVGIAIGYGNKLADLAKTLTP